MIVIIAIRRLNFSVVGFTSKEKVGGEETWILPIPEGPESRLLQRRRRQTGGTNLPLEIPPVSVNLFSVQDWDSRFVF